MPTTPTWATLIKRAIDKRLVDLHVSLPGKIVSYDAVTQTAEIQPQLGRYVAATDDQEALEETLPPLVNVPILHPRGGGFFVSFPLAVGDSVLILIVERDYSQWLENGQETTPADQRMHDLSFAVAIPTNFYPKEQALKEADPAKLIIGHDEGAQVRIDAAGLVEVGKQGETYQAVALADDVKARFDSLQTAHDGHVHITTATIGASAAPGILAPTAAPVGPLAEVGSSKVKVEI
ncbi:MAG: hypothetical protein JRD89_01435 [Deltaproteobacteria bacterium]|nr:hypothetical protein [Deltaproteobacteria bacterium]